MGENRIQSFRDLDAWKVAMDLTVLSYGIAKRLPSSERFGLGSQIRRAAVSVPSNVAEGQSCGKTGRYIAHVRIALGSLGEVATDLELSRRLGFFTNKELTDVEDQLARTAQLLHGLRRSLQKTRLVKASRGLALLLCLAFWGSLFSVLY